MFPFANKFKIRDPGEISSSPRQSFSKRRRGCGVRGPPAHAAAGTDGMRSGGTEGVVGDERRGRRARRTRRDARGGFRRRGGCGSAIREGWSSLCGFAAGSSKGSRPSGKKAGKVDEYFFPSTLRSFCPRVGRLAKPPRIAVLPGRGRFARAGARCPPPALAGGDRGRVSCVCPQVVRSPDPGRLRRGRLAAGRAFARLRRVRLYISKKVMDKNVMKILTFLSTGPPARNTSSKTAGQRGGDFSYRGSPSARAWKSRKIDIFLSMTFPLIFRLTACEPARASCPPAPPARLQGERRPSRAAYARNLHQSKICGGFVSRQACCRRMTSWSTGLFVRRP